ncbi:MAG: hypothetical protein ACSHW0_02110 [Thalassotalea sp.]
MSHLSRLFLTVLLFTLTSLASYAADKPNVLILGEDSQKESVPRNNAVYTRVLQAVSEQLHVQNFNVYDETTITLAHFKQGRTGRTDSELIDIARSIRQPPIDVVVLFTIYASQQKQDHTTKVKARIEGRMLQVQTGKYLGSFEVSSGKLWQAPVGCDRSCLYDVVGDKARILASDLALVLTEKLAWLYQDDQASTLNSNNMLTEYVLVFDGFTEQDFSGIEEYLVVFSGYNSHRPIEARYTFHEIWYQSSIAIAKLNRNLKKMLAELEYRSHITFEGNTFTIHKIHLRSK